jgi:peptidoglycan/LPS O-acetylase OafA/YrhL
LIVLGAAVRAYDREFAYVRFEGRDYMMLHARVDTLMFGCLFALCSGMRRFEAVYAGFRKVWWVAPLWFLAGGNLMTRWGGLNFRLSPGLTFNGLAIAFFVLYVARSPSTWLGRALSWRPVAYVGVISYSMYLWQEIFTAPENTSWMGRMPGMLVCIAIAPVLSYELVEKPVLKLRGRWMGKSRADLPLVSSSYQDRNADSLRE